MPDKIIVEILEDGTMKIETDSVSMPNHAGAEALLRDMIKDMGGDATRTRKGGKHVHGHVHDGHYHEH